MSSHPPPEPRIHPRISWHRPIPAIPQVAHVVRGAIPLEVTRQVHLGANLYLIFRSVIRPFGFICVLASGIENHVQMNGAVSGADSPSGSHVPVCENFSAVSVGAGGVTEEKWQYHMRSSLICSEVGCARIEGLKVVIETAKGCHIHRELLNRLSAVTDFKVAEPFGLSLCVAVVLGYSEAARRQCECVRFDLERLLLP